MKYLLLGLLILGTSFNSMAQTNKAVKTSPKMERMTIVEPGIRSVSALSDFFNPVITKKLLTQVSETELKSIKTNCNEGDYPECIKKTLSYNPSDPNSDAKSDKLIKSLVLYRIAKFDNIRGKENFGEYSVLIAPAAENKNILEGCTYTKDFYVLIPTKGTKIVK
ncbi:MAG: hypothetical protein CFE25_02050 [Chitinophagaceae bacterium BSSC1]|nr:MAG: hypothetical protein CFE25_02050 [Chitinophagaceae bacterium BSSC1]